MANSVRVAAVQMTSMDNIAANFATCSRLVKVLCTSAFSKDSRHQIRAKFWGKVGHDSRTRAEQPPSRFQLQIPPRKSAHIPPRKIAIRIQEAAAAGAKMVCFPESFSYVGSNDVNTVKIGEPLDGPIMKGYCSLARESKLWLSLGGFQERGFDDEHLRNTHVLIDDVGNIRSTYSKIHMFDVDIPGGAVYKESSFTEPGKDIVAADSPLGPVGLTVCYDMRFPGLYEQLRFNHEAQVLLIPAAFTKVTGQAHWEILLRARAIETQCYVIAAAQAGKHNENRESYGDTLIIDPWGTIVGRLSDRLSTGITVADIDFSLIDSVRAKMPIAKQRKPFEFQK